MTQKNELSTRQGALSKMLTRGIAQIEAGAAANINPDKLIRLVLNAAIKNPAIANCTDASIISCVLTCSQWGLVPDGRNCYLIPYGKDVKECQVIPSYRGLKTLARKCPGSPIVESHVVYDQDYFEFELGTTPLIKHVPNLTEDRGELLAAYAVATYSDGRKIAEVMSRADVLKRKEFSLANKRNTKDSPWVKWEPEMWVKTAAKRLCAQMDSDPHGVLHEAVEFDNLHESGMQQPYIVPPAKLESRSDELVEQLGVEESVKVESATT